MELRHLRYFVSVAEAASVSKAARRVNICQPALSRQIRDLEAELGVRLFDRIGRRIQLTAGGEDLLGRSRDVLAHAEALIEHARSLAGRSAGILRVGATPQTLQSVLAAFLLKFQRARPGVDIRLTEDGGVRLYELVERGEIHLALSGILTGRPLESRPLFPIRVLAVAAIRQNRPLAAADRRPNGLTHWKLQPSVRTSGPMAERSVFTMSTDTRGGNRGTWSRFEPLARNGRYPLRQIRRNPGFSAIAIVTLALGIGANTAMFSAVDAVLIRSLLYADAGRLVVVWTNSLRTGESKFYLTPPE